MNTSLIGLNMPTHGTFFIATPNAHFLPWLRHAWNKIYDTPVNKEPSRLRRFYNKLCGKLVNKDSYHLGWIRLQLLELQVDEQEGKENQSGVEKPLPYWWDKLQLPELQDSEEGEGEKNQDEFEKEKQETLIKSIE